MHIGINAYGIAHEPRLGVADYVLNVGEELLKIDPTNRYTFYTDKPLSEAFITKSDNIKVKILHFPEFHLFRYNLTPLVWREIKLATEIFFHSPDIFFDVEVALPSLFRWHRPSKVISMLHGMIPLLFPKDFPKFPRMINNYYILNAAKHADRIITPSESAKRDLIRVCQVKPEKISVIPQGYDPVIFKPNKTKEKIEEAKNKYGIDSCYILHVGFLYPYKNTKTLVKAFGQLKTQRKIPHKLVLAGPRIQRFKNLFKEIIELINKFELEKEVILTGWISSREELASLMKGADLFVFPSSYEGFGIPPLEAMACGTPVITSNISSLPEVVGDAGLLVNPHNPEELTEGIYKVLLDEGLRQHMSEKGLKRAKLFSWERTARETLEVLQKVTYL